MFSPWVYDRARPNLQANPDQVIEQAEAEIKDCEVAFASIRLRSIGPPSGLLLVSDEDPYPERDCEPMPNTALEMTHLYYGAHQLGTAGHPNATSATHAAATSTGARLPGAPGISCLDANA